VIPSGTGAAGPSAAAVDHLEAVAGRDAAVRQVAEHVRVRIGYAGERTPGAGRQRLEALGADLLDRQLARGDRIAVGVVGGIAELGRDQLLEVLGQHVLEDLRLLVHAVPRNALRCSLEIMVALNLTFGNLRIQISVQIPTLLDDTGPAPGFRALSFVK
jgi:hypothetical protein